MLLGRFPRNRVRFPTKRLLLLFHFLLGLFFDSFVLCHLYVKKSEPSATYDYTTKVNIFGCPLQLQTINELPKMPTVDYFSISVLFKKFLIESSFTRCAFDIKGGINANKVLNLPLICHLQGAI